MHIKPNKSNKTLGRRRSDEHGFILITAYILISAASILSLGLFSRNLGFIQSVERNQNRLVAFHMAESGVDTALIELAKADNYSGTGGYVSLDSTYSEGGYEVLVTTPTGSPNIRIIQATGHSPDNDASSTYYEKRSITVYAEINKEKYFEFGVFAKSNLVLNGSGNVTVDSYNSSIAPYDSANPGLNGNISTNATSNGAVALTGGVQVKGDAYVGPNGNPTTAITIGPNATITGTTAASSESKSLPEATTSAASSGSLTVSGGTTYLASGTHRFSSISISGQGQISLLGPVTIYVDGQVDIAGNGIANPSQLPSDLILFVKGTDVSISGNGSLYGAIYAPDASVSINGNGALYGAVVANTYDQTGNAAVHFDEALKDNGGSGTSGIDILAWQEENTFSWGMG